MENQYLKTTFLFLVLSLFTTSMVQANTPEQRESEHIKEILSNWDAKKGAWLYESINALVMGTEAPDRMDNSVQETTFELLNSMTENRFNRVYRAASQELKTEREERANQRRKSKDPYYWEQWMMVLDRTNCEVSRGRSNGDPHFTSFDGKKFDFQNAGDYLLTSSLATNFDMQVRQERLNERISVNGSTAINVNGDTLVIYAQKDGKQGVFILNGQRIENPKEAAYFKRGGVMRFEKNRYVVNSPTGEQVHIKMRHFSKRDLLDIDVFAPSCGGDYQGLFGDADGDVSNDLRTADSTLVDNRDRTSEAVFGAGRRNATNSSNEANYLNFISRDFGDQFIVQAEWSLFDEPWVDIPDSIRYPIEPTTLENLEDEQIEEALKICKEAGVAEDDLMGCVYDYGYVGLTPELPAEYTGNQGTREVGSTSPKPVEDKPRTADDDNRPTLRTGPGPIIIIPPVRRHPRPVTQPAPTRTPSSVRTPRR